MNKFCKFSHVKIKTACGYLIVIQLFFPVILPFSFSFNLALFSRKISQTKHLTNMIFKHIGITLPRELFEISLPGPLAQRFCCNWSGVGPGTMICKSSPQILICSQDWEPLLFGENTPRQGVGGVKKKKKNTLSKSQWPSILFPKEKDTRCCRSK